MRQSIASLFFVACFGLALVAACSSTDASPVSADAGGDELPAVPEDASTAPPTSTCGSCKGCCLPDGTCVKSTSAKQCGSGGSACVACEGDDKGCVGGACGCSSNAQCKTGLVCDVLAAKCVKPCTATSCATGCCAADGVCRKGNETKACGTSGSCIDCAKAVAGSACLGTKCGCNTADDCPSGQACDSATKTCTTTCNANQTCNGGCCDATSSQCIVGNFATKCGATGGMCTDCTGNPNGTSCVAGACGCTSFGSCAVGMACNQATKTCGTACNANQACNGACCSKGTCKPGNTDDACGAPTTTCLDCGVATTGPTCMTSGVGNQVCGCSANDDCVGTRECKAGAGRSYKWCCLPTGSACVVGNNECCSGSCSGIGGNTKCN